MPPTLLFGTSSFAMTGTTFQTSTDIQPLLTYLTENSINALDTAARYPPNAPGASESLIGSTHLPTDLTIDTKVFTSATGGGGELTRSNIHGSVVASLARLKTNKINVLYAHASDATTPLLEQAETFNEMIRLGYCNAWGVSNHSIPHLRSLLDICEEHKLKKPSVYQGMYNAVTRGAEAELLPLLRTHGIKFYAYSPLAAGLLTGNVATGNAAGTRFDPNHNPVADRIHAISGAEGLGPSIRAFREGCATHHLQAVEVALRWVYWHSSLGDEDGIILGASKLQQVDGNLQSMRKGPLEQELVGLCEDLWRSVEGTRKEML